VRKARRGDVDLVRLRSGLLGIRWGRRLSRDAGVPAIEATGTDDEREARKILERRRIEVYASLGGVRPIAAPIPSVSLGDLVGDFLDAFLAGELPGRKPSTSTVALYRALLTGMRTSGLRRGITLGGRTIANARPSAGSGCSRRDVVTCPPDHEPLPASSLYWAPQWTDGDAVCRHCDARTELTT